LFTYDHAGRVKDAKSGIEAHGQTQTILELLPYRQAYTFNAFDNITGRTSTMWDYPGSWNFSYNLTNNRASGSLYDNDGRETRDSSSIRFNYDAAGSMIKTWRNYSTYVVYETLLDHDGDGVEAKRSHRNWDEEDSGWEAWKTNYFVFSRVLGKTVTEVSDTGKKKVTYVIDGGGTIAKQVIGLTNQEGVAWKHTDASGLSSRSSTITSNPAGFLAEELDALGNNVGTFAHPTPPSHGENSRSRGAGFVFESTDWGDCSLDGIMTPCSMALRGGGEAIEMIVGQRWNPKGRWEYNTASMDQSFRGNGSYRFFIPGMERDVADSTNPDNLIFRTAETPGHWFTFEFDSSDTSVREEDHCRLMVGKLREIMARSLNAVGPIKDMTGVDKLVKEIDSAFHQFFVGPMTMSSGQAAGPPVSYWGAFGFKPELKDSLNEFEDQTHHFVQYFHTGIWATQSWKAYVHPVIGLDLFNNDGDMKLGSAAFELGESLRTRQIGTQTRMNRNNPRLPFPEKVPIYENYEDRKKRVFGISDAILNKICD
jgi:hypothetical protein